MLGPSGVVDELRRGFEVLRAIERRRASENALMAALPSGLATEALGRSFVAALEDLTKTATEFASFQTVLDRVRLGYPHLLVATAQSASLATALQNLSPGGNSQAINALNTRGTDLSLAVREVYAELATNPTVIPTVSESLREAPAPAANAVNH
jgi:hypothetical protein